MNQLNELQMFQKVYANAKQVIVDVVVIFSRDTRQALEMFLQVRLGNWLARRLFLGAGTEDDSEDAFVERELAHDGFFRSDVLLSQEEKCMHFIEVLLDDPQEGPDAVEWHTLEVTVQRNG